MTANPTRADELVEAMARVLCERQIRRARRWDTDPQELEDMLPASIDYSWSDHADDATALLPFITAARREALEEAARACEVLVQDFLSPEYATGQPFSSFGERFACGRCITVIRALDDRSAGEGV